MAVAKDGVRAVRAVAIERIRKVLFVVGVYLRVRFQGIYDQKGLAGPQNLTQVSAVRMLMRIRVDGPYSLSLIWGFCLSVMPATKYFIAVSFGFRPIAGRPASVASLDEQILEPMNNLVID